MKITFSILSLFVCALSAHAGDFEYRGYMRTPTGSNSEGGKQIQIVNPGSQGNEFRLGNEVAYGEAYFTEQFLKRAQSSDSFFNANLTIGYAPSMNSQYSDTTATGDFIQILEAYAKGGNLDDLKMSFWAGKRFYRDVDVHMDDFFYFANMSGDGGGVEDIPVGNGTLAVAVLQYTDDRTLTKTTSGNPAKHALDVRWRDIVLSDNNHLHLWAAAAYTGPGTGTATTITPPATVGANINYQASNGEAVGARLRHKMVQGDNDFAVMYGTGVMESFNLDNTAIAADDSVKNRKRLRIVENYSKELSDRWAIEAAAIYEAADSGLPANSKSNWTSIGARPMYYISEHFRIQAEAGYSIVNNQAEVDPQGNGYGQRTLERLTISPEVAFGKGYYARPVVRFYVTATHWNDANKDANNSGSLIGKMNRQTTDPIYSLNNKNDELQTGFEAEVWF